VSIQNLSTLLSTAQVATYLDISPRTVLAWVQQGRLPQPLRIGKAPLWEMRELAMKIDAVRAQRDEAAKAPKRRTPKPVLAIGKGFTSSKELQLMMALKRAQLFRAAAGASGSRRQY